MPDSTTHVPLRPARDPGHNDDYDRDDDDRDYDRDDYDRDDGDDRGRVREQDPEPRPAPMRSAAGLAGLRSRMPLWVRLVAVDPALRGALALAVVALAGVAVASWIAWQHRPGPPAAGSAAAVEAAPAASGASAAPGTGPVPTVARTPGSGRVTSGGGDAPASPSTVVVDVAGLVSTPGVVTLSPGARIVDALEVAGGVLPGTDTTGLSLARPLVDGEQILVDGRPGPAAPVVGAGPLDGGGTGTGTSGSGTSSGAAGPVNLNTATAAEFDTLPGIGPVLAQRIVDWRDSHGGFASPEQLGEVSGLGDKRLAELLPLVTV